MPKNKQPPGPRRAGPGRSAVDAFPQSVGRGVARHLRLRAPACGGRPLRRGIGPSAASWSQF